MAQNDLLYTHLVTRGLHIPNQDMSKEILESEDMLAGIAGIIGTYEAPFKALLQARIAPLKEQLIMNAEPQEVLVLRQCMLEVAMIFDDALKYSQEYRKRHPEPGVTAPVEPATIVDNGGTPNAADNGAQKLE